MNPWEILGAGPDVGVSGLRRRYAALIKEFRPETHPQDFARIREAYEMALPIVRRREAEAAEAALAENQEVDIATTPDEPPPVAQDADVLALYEEIAAQAEVVAAAPVADEASGQEQESRLAAHFRGFHAIAALATGTNDEAHLPALRVLLQARAQATLDDSQALEFALMRWFIEGESPPLTLLFETGRAFDWHRHVVRLSSWLSPWALRQMEARLALSRDLVYARHFSGNLRLRRLHAAHPGPGLLVMRPAAVEAMAWAERWRRLGEDADAMPPAASLNPVAMRQLRGPASTDVLVGLAVAIFAPDLPAAFAWGVVAAAVVFGLHRALLAILDLTETNRLRRVARTIAANKVVSGVLIAVSAWVGTMVFATPDAGDSIAETALAATLMVPLALVAIAGAWRIAAFLESLVAWHFQWREAVDRLEFDTFLRSNAMPAANQPFGPRLGFVQRLQAIRAALRLQTVEIATRERPPRAQPIKRWRLTGLRFVGLNGQSRWRLLWFGAWVLFAVLRLVHAFGGAN
jgi:hypothetical protein